MDAFETSVQLREVARFETLGEERQLGARLAPRIAEHLGLDTAKKLIIASAIPAHAGLGSGTQLTMAIASAFRRFAGLRLDPIGDGRLLDRGARSGAAVLFERGGLVVDAGRGPNTEIGPVAARVTFPPDWPVLLMLDPRIEGAHGEAEKQAFSRLPRSPVALPGEICRRTLMQILSGAAEGDFASFGEGVSRVQEIVGAHFAPVHGGGRFTSRAVSNVAERLASVQTTTPNRALF